MVVKESILSKSYAPGKKKKNFYIFILRLNICSVSGLTVRGKP